MQKTLHRHRPSRTDRSVIVEQDTDDLTLVMATLSGGAVGTFEASKIATGAQDELGFEIRGTKGALRFSLMDANYLDWFDQSDPEAPLGGTAGFKRIHCVRRYAPPAGWPAPKSTIGWLRGHLHCVYSFISAVDAGLPFDPSISRGVEIERWCAGIQRAADTGQRVVL